MSAQGLLKQTELEFKNASGNTGAISFTNDDEFECDRAAKFASGVVASSLTIGAGAGFSASSRFDDVEADTLKLKDNSGDVITLAAPASITAYTLTFPSATGANEQILQTDGSGNLSFVDIPSSGFTPAYGTMAEGGGVKFTKSVTSTYSKLGDDDLALVGASAGVTFSSANKRLTVAAAGTYCVTGSFFADYMDGQKYHYLAAFVNGSESELVTAGYWGHSGTNNDNGKVGFDGFLSLSANDYVELHVKTTAQNGSSTTDSWNVSDVRLSLQRIA